jgi:hypothetical protein
MLAVEVADYRFDQDRKCRESPKATRRPPREDALQPAVALLVDHACIPGLHLPGGW